MTLDAKRDESAFDTRVRIISGSLKGVEGTVVRRPASGRLLINLEAGQRGAYVEIDANSVRYIKTRRAP
jgi:hypothetical protein